MLPANVFSVFTVPWISVFTPRAGSEAYTWTPTASKPFAPAAPIVCCRNELASIFVGPGLDGYARPPIRMRALESTERRLARTELSNAPYWDGLGGFQ